MNAVPTADGGPRVIICTVGADGDETGEDAPDAEPPMPPAPGNGHDTVCDAERRRAGDPGLPAPLTAHGRFCGAIATAATRPPVQPAGCLSFPHHGRPPT